MKARKAVLFISMALFLANFSFRVSVRAEDSSPSGLITEDERKEAERLIKKYTPKWEAAQNKGKTLSGEIEVFDEKLTITQSKISNSTIKISGTEEEIGELSQDIGKLGDRIERLKEATDKQQRILEERMREKYMSKESSPIMVIFGSETLSSLVQKAKYLEVMGLQDTKLLTEMEDTKNKFDQQKGLLEGKREEEEQLKAQLQIEKGNLLGYKTSLEGQQDEKEQLLEDTKGDEERYQKIVKEAQEILDAYKAFSQGTGLGVIGPNGLGGGKGGWYYSQRDSRWANNNIRGSSYSLKDAGCLVSSVAMLHKYYGYSADPGDIADVNSYCSFGDMRIPWPAPGGRGYRLLNWGHTSKIDDELEDDNPVIVGIRGIANSAGTHFVVLSDTDDGDYIMYDPIYGPDLEFSDYYSKGNIFQAVVFK